MHAAVEARDWDRARALAGRDERLLRLVRHLERVPSAGSRMAAAGADATRKDAVYSEAVAAVCAADALGVDGSDARLSAAALALEISRPAEARRLLTETPAHGLLYHYINAAVLLWEGKEVEAGEVTRAPADVTRALTTTPQRPLSTPRRTRA